MYGSFGDTLDPSCLHDLNELKSIVPFLRSLCVLRDSKLTRILADSLGGGANAALLATVGPAPQNQVTLAVVYRGKEQRRCRTW